MNSEDNLGRMSKYSRAWDVGYMAAVEWEF